MIVKMKKVSLIVINALQEEALQRLRSLGVLHLEARSASSETLEGLLDQRARLERALLLLPQGKGKQRQPGNPTPNLSECLAVAGRVAELNEEARSQGEELERLQREADRLKIWGDFEPDEIQELRNKGIYLRLYELSSEQYRQLPAELMSWVLAKDKNLVRLAAVFLRDTGFPDVPEFPLPSRSLSQVGKLMAAKAAALRELQGELEGLLGWKERIEASLGVLDRDIEFEQARADMGVDGPLAFLTGYLPAAAVDQFRRAAVQNGWAYLIDDPQEDDPVPTLIKNPRLIQIIQPIFKLMDTVPGYREYDISFWFLLFFSLFFAMLIGDAGYGLLFLGLTLVARLASRRAPAGPFLLLFVLSISTVIWGALSGTWFGVEVLSKNRILAPLIIPEIASFGVDNAKSIMMFCFVIGVAHLSLARLIAFVKNIPRLAGIAQLGWLSLVWGMFFMVRYIVLRLPLNPLGLWLIAAGLGLVMLFDEQQGRFFKGLFLGLAKFPLKLLDAIGTFSNIISYVRLFAVGLATVEVAKSFNTMAAGIGFGMPLGLASAFILFFGHVLNIAMGAMSVIVHGVRLNMLEFSGQLGMEWTGIPYKPFSVDRKEH